MIWIIGRIEGETAVCENLDGERRMLLPSQLPAGAKEGDVIREEGGVYWADPEATLARRRRIQTRFARLLHPQDNTANQ